MESEHLRIEYEAKLADMKSSYKAVLMSIQKIQEEMERLKNYENNFAITVTLSLKLALQIKAAGACNLSINP